MNQSLRIAPLLVALAACGSDARNAPPPTATSVGYRTDIEKLCEVLARSGADQLAPGDRAFATASWLAANFQTSEVHDYLVQIQPLAPEAKAAALESEAKRVGLVHCALADEWHGTGQPTR